MKKLLVGLLALGNLSVFASNKAINICYESVNVLKHQHQELTDEEEQSFQQCVHATRNEENCKKRLNMNNESKEIINESIMRVEQYCQQKYYRTYKARQVISPCSKQKGL